MRLDIYHHFDQRVLDKLEFLTAGQEIIMDSLERIEAAIAARTTVDDSVLALVTDLKHQVADALANTKLPADVEARLAAIFPKLEEENARVAAALVANTPAEGTTATPPSDLASQPVPAPELPLDPPVTGTTNPDPSASTSTT